MKPDYSNFTYQGIKLDPYRILEIYGITHPAHQHALKKLLRAGRSHKPLAQDIQETIDALVRWQEMINQDHPPACQCGHPPHPRLIGGVCPTCFKTIIGL